MHKNLFRFAIVAVFAMSLAPLAGNASHCPAGVFVFFGVDTGVAHPQDGGTIKQGQNPGAVGCTADANDESLNTNLIVPGATHAIVGTTITNQFGATPVGTIRYEGEAFDDTFNLTFTAYNSARGRWEADGSGILFGSHTITATVWLPGFEEDAQSIEYHAAA